jgi:hypothetical protein
MHVILEGNGLQKLETEITGSESMEIRRSSRTVAPSEEDDMHVIFVKYFL